MQTTSHCNSLKLLFQLSVYQGIKLYSLETDQLKPTALNHPSKNIILNSQLFSNNYDNLCFHPVKYLKNQDPQAGQYNVLFNVYLDNM